jgi:Rrf2 family protein
MRRHFDTSCALRARLPIFRRMRSGAAQIPNNSPLFPLAFGLPYLSLVAEIPELFPPINGVDMQITRTADYGVRVMTHLAMLPPGSRMTVADLAHESNASVAFTGKILQRLVGARLVVSHRGYEGGFELGRLPDTITLLDIVTALEGPLCLNQCLPGGPGCERSTWCGAHDVWANAQAALAAALSAETLERLAATATRNRARLNATAQSRVASLEGAAADA